MHSDFRDFMGWTSKISGAQYVPAWRQLAQDVLKASQDIGPHRLAELKRDVIFDIMGLVVKKKPHETDKLVSTNARRQLNNKNPKQHTLMTLLEMHIGEMHNLRSRSSGGGSSSAMGGSSMAPVASSSSSMGMPVARGGASSSGPSRKVDRGSSAGSSSRSGDRHAVRTSTAMEISALLSGEGGSSGAGSSSAQRRLPSITQLDAHIQARKEKDKQRDKRHRR